MFGFGVGDQLCRASRLANSCSGSLFTGRHGKGWRYRPLWQRLEHDQAGDDKPATIDYRDVERRTPEYRTSRSEGVRRGSARSDILISQMKYRIKEAVALAARSEGVDCVVRKGDIKDANGLAIMDLTDQVIAELESGGATP
jgi:hypothetical protein